MSARHTPGRINVNGTRLYADDLPGIDCIATMQVSNQPMWDQDARRLVACWNACEGIITDALEQDDAPRKLREDRDMLLAQRDELMVALQEAKANAGNPEAVYRITSAAIAKATGTITQAERQAIDDKLREEYRVGFDGPPAN